MAEAIFQAVWPITDSTYTAAELINTATDQLEKLADRTHALLTGPPAWWVMPAADVVGWQAYAPGDVLICRAPAVDVRVSPLRCHDVDESEVEAALDRNRAPRRAADRYEAVRRLSEDVGLDHETTAARLGVTKDVVEQALARTRRRQREVAA